MDWARLRNWFDNPILVKHVRSRLRLQPVFSSLVVLALTSSSEQRDVKTAYQHHINAYLVKPSSLTEMVELARAIRHFWLEQDHLIRPRISFPSTLGVPPS